MQPLQLKTLLAIYLATGRYPHMEGNYYNLMGVYPALLCGIGVVTFLGIVIFFWERKGAKYSLEWILAEPTTRLAFGYQRRLQRRFTNRISEQG